MQGWIKLHRKILEWEWYKDINTKVVFLHLLLSANIKDVKYMGTVVKKGSLITKRADLARDLNLTENEIRTALNHLKNTGEILIKTTNKFSVITIVNYSGFQELEAKKPPANHQQTTSRSPTINQPLTSIEEERKEEKEFKNKNKAAMCAGEDVPTTSPTNSDEPTTGDNNADEKLLKQISALYFELTGRMCSANDYVAITQITEQTQDFELIKNVMLDLHSRYKPNYAGDKIKSFKYFTGAVFEAVEKQKKYAEKKYVDDEKLNKVLNDFMRYREQTGSPVYDTQMLLNNLYSLEPESIDNQILILQNSISNGWKGLFPLKQQKQQAKPQNNSRFVNYEQREYNPVKMREFERKILQKDIEKLRVK